MKKIALSQSQSMLADLDFHDYGEIVLIGKSVGTIVAAAIASQNEENEKIRFVLYTPLEDTFSFPLGDAVVFTGTGDPWVGKKHSRIPEMCQERGISCYVYPKANHSLETGNIWTDVDNMKQIMERTESFMKGSNAGGNC